MKLKSPLQKPLLGDHAGGWRQQQHSEDEEAGILKQSNFGDYEDRFVRDSNTNSDISGGGDTDTDTDPTDFPLHISPRVMAFVEKSLENSTFSAFKNVLKSRPFTLCHGDMHADNIYVMDEEGKGNVANLTPGIHSFYYDLHHHTYIYIYFIVSHINFFSFLSSSHHPSLPPSIPHSLTPSLPPSLHPSLPSFLSPINFQII